MRKQVRTHFGWRCTNYSTCYHCDTEKSSWAAVWRIRDRKRLYVLFSCRYCGGLDLEVENLRTQRVITKPVTKEEAKAFLLAIKL